MVITKNKACLVKDKLVALDNLCLLSVARRKKGGLVTHLFQELLSFFSVCFAKAQLETELE